MPREEFAKYTEKIRSMLPFWFKMKKQPNESLGLQFLNIAGMELCDIEKILNYAYEQTKIDTIDDSFVDVIYKVILPTYYDIDSIDAVETNLVLLEETKSLYEFFNLEENYGLNNNIKQPDFYYIDRDRNIIYVREPYDRSNANPFGKIKIRKKKSKLEDKLEEFNLSLHHVWNFFDEFGALVGCQRLFGEKNLEYKRRILDVFINPANSTKIGLANGIARDLGVREILKWENVREDFVIKDKMLIANSITVDGKPVKIEDICVTTDGYLLIQSMPFYENDWAEVSYIRGIEMSALIDKDNVKINNELYNSDCTPTELLLHYISIIKESSSVLWGDFKYNEGMWVTNNEEFINSHFAFIPARYDSEIKGFAKYGFSHKGKTIR